MPKTVGICRACGALIGLNAITRDSMNSSVRLHWREAPPPAFQPPRECQPLHTLLSLLRLLTMSELPLMVWICCVVTMLLLLQLPTRKSGTSLLNGLSMRIGRFLNAVHVKPPMP